jgi:hypothetical protein
MSLAALVALEFWRASGLRTLDRLESLCDHFAAVYAIPAEQVRQEARAAVRTWEIEIGVNT